MRTLFNLFGPSPIRPIEQHMRKTYQCAKQLHPFFEAVLIDDWKTATKINDRIATLEKEADIIKRDLRLHLPTSLFLPVARTDLLELLSAQDRIANRAQDIAGLIVSRRMVIPQSLSTLWMPFLDRCLDAAKQACQAINELDELLESGFRGSEVKIVEEMIMKLDEIEHDSDKQLAAMRDAMVELGGDPTLINPLVPAELVIDHRTVADIGPKSQVTFDQRRQFAERSLRHLSRVSPVRQSAPEVEAAAWRRPGADAKPFELAGNLSASSRQAGAEAGHVFAIAAIGQRSYDKLGRERTRPAEVRRHQDGACALRH